MKKLSVYFLLAALIFVSAKPIQAQTKLIEKVVKKGNEVVIPYEKYVLPNGLTLIIHEDHSDPVVHVDVTYHVGSAREQEGRSGFAHFFEHMLFQGSKHVGDDQHFRIVSEAGGTLNGSTNTDRTNYFETLPINQLETALWLEADRMGYFLDSVTQQKFEIQRETVKNERGQNYDNRPYGLAGEKIGEALYPNGHPYSWETIGYIEDLNRSNLKDLKNFFMRWYGPNNATLTIAGDVSPKEVIKLVEKYFGPIPRGPEVKPMAKVPAKLDKDRYISYEDNIRSPLLSFSYPGVENYNADEAPLDVLSDILGGGKNSIFYKNFVKTGLARQANVSNPCSELAGNFSISILAFPGKTLAEMEALVRKSLEEFEKRGVTDDDLIKYKATYESSVIRSLNSVNGKAAQLAAYQTFTGNANYIKQDLDRYAKVTREDVLRVYNTYIKNKFAVILSVYPKGKPELIARPDNYELPKRTIQEESAEYKNLSYTEPKDNFDRGKQPAPGANPVVKIPEIWTENFPNGLKLIGAKNDETPSVTLQLSIEAGHRFEDKTKAGIAQLTAELLNESTQLRSAEDVSLELEKLGSSIDINSGTNEINIIISSLTKNLDRTLKIAEEIILKPKFDTEEFERDKKQQLEAIENQSTQPVTIANNVYSKILYGEGHIMAIPIIGTKESVNSITLEDVKAYYQNMFSPSISKLVIVGDVTKEGILPKLDFLKTWQKKEVKRPAELSAPKINKTILYLVNKEKAPQSEIRIGYIALPYDATGEYYKATLANYPLGAAFSSRINLNLREDKGWTYGARSSFQGTKFPGPFTASGGVRGNATDSSVVEFMKELKNYRDNGISQKELDFTKSSIGQSDALKYETPGQKAGFIKRILDYNLDKNYVAKQTEILNSITKADLDALAKKHLPVENMVMVVVGDKEKILPGLQKLGYEIIEMDAEGNKVSASVNGSNNPAMPTRPDQKR